MNYKQKKYDHFGSMIQQMSTGFIPKFEQDEAGGTGAYMGEIWPCSYMRHDDLALQLIASAANQ